MVDLLKTSFFVAVALMPLAIAVMIKMDFLYAVVGLVITMIISYNILRNWFDQYRIPNVGGKYVLVTGCDTGFGRALAERLVKKGVKVIAACLKEESVAQLQEAEEENMIAVQMDVSNPDSIQKAYNDLITAHPQVQHGLWGIINNAGLLGLLVPSEWLKYEDYRKIFNVNVFGPIMVTNKFLTLVKRAKGRVINTASYLARVSPPNNSQYAMSKHALRSYTDSLRREMHVFGVSVHTIEPGAFKTGLTQIDVLRSGSERLFNSLDSELKEQYGQEFLDTTNKITSQSLEWVCSTKTHMVVDAYEHALFATYPRTRYRVGMDSRFFSFFALLPDWLEDLLFHLTAPKVPGVKSFSTQGKSNV